MRPTTPTPYTLQRAKIRSGDLLAWSHRGWGSWYDVQIQLVRTFTQSEYCHVGVAYVVKDRVCVFEAVGAGVRIFPLSRLLPFYHVPLQLSWNKSAEDFVWAHLGDKYSKLQAIAAYLGKLQLAVDDVWQCCELEMELHALLGLVVPGKATPSSVMHAVQGMTGAPLKLVVAAA